MQRSFKKEQVLPGKEWIRMSENNSYLDEMVYELNRVENRIRKLGERSEVHKDTKMENCEHL